MALMHRLFLVVLLSVAAVWAQSPRGSATPGTPPSSQTEFKLEPIATPSAAYPGLARDQKAEGEIIASLLVSDTGDVKNVRVFRGDPLLVKSVEDAVSKWKFKPVTKGDKAIPVIATARFKFVLSDDKQAVGGVAPELEAAHEVPQRVENLKQYKRHPSHAKSEPNLSRKSQECEDRRDSALARRHQQRRQGHRCASYFRSEGTGGFSHGRGKAMAI